MQVALELLRPACADEKRDAERNGSLVDVVLGSDAEMVSLARASVKSRDAARSLGEKVTDCGERLRPDAEVGPASAPVSLDETRLEEHLEVVADVPHLVHLRANTAGESLSAGPVFRNDP